MKKIYVTLVAAFAIVQFSYGQWNPVTAGIYYSSGNVGIGTNSPATALSVVGTGSFSNSIVAGTTTLTSAGLQFSDSYTGYFNGTVNNGGLGYSLKAYHGIEVTNAMGVAARFGSSDNSLNSYFNGNVGIGTNSPATALSVVGTGSFSNSIVAGTATLTGAALQFSDSYTGYFNGTVNNGGLGFSLKAYHGIEMTNAMGVAARFGSSDNSLNSYFNGNVGIGTTTPDTKLAVNGTIRAKEVKVDLTDWPDYVFKPKYALPSLTEVKNYIGQNHHLPDMPSEHEVAKDGINLGEMNKLLTKKVEELTLYLIEQQKQTAQIKQQQDARIAALEKALSKRTTRH